MLDLKFRAKQKNNSEKYYYGIPKLIHTDNGNSTGYEKWYISNFELCVNEIENSFYKAGERYKSAYSVEIDIETLEISINNLDYELCKISNLLTQKYEIVGS